MPRSVRRGGFRYVVQVVIQGPRSVIVAIVVGVV